MATKKQYKCVALMIPFVALTLVANLKIVLGVENPYKYEKQEERFQKSSLQQFNTNLNQTFEGLEQRSDNLEAMNQNLEGRINVLSAEKDKLNKAYAQMKVKQATLEKEHAKLKKKTTSLEVAYKKLSSKKGVAVASKKPKVVAKKTAVAKKTSKKTSTAPKTVAKKAAGKKVSRAEKKEDTAILEPTPPIEPAVPAVSAVKPPEERKGETVSEINIQKINEKGIEYGKKGMYDLAIKEFQKVAAIDPNMPNIHYNLSLAYKKKGMLAEAEKEYAEYERLKSQNN